ncbi:MAG: hypothetical protein U0T69_11435 [Chitinophagales bacterium]
MNTRQTLSNLLSFLIDNRIGGTTTLIEKTAIENDCKIIVHTDHGKKEFKSPMVREKCVSFSDLKNHLGKKAVPVLIDNAALIKFLEMSIQEISMHEWIPIVKFPKNYDEDHDDNRFLIYDETYGTQAAIYDSGRFFVPLTTGVKEFFPKFYRQLPKAPNQ